MVSHDDKLEEVAKFFEKMSGSNSQALRWELKRLREYRDGLFEEHPFKVGDKVKLNHTPDLKPTSGWYGHRHYLTKDAIATVHGLDWSRNKGFLADVTFDGEWYQRTYPKKRVEMVAEKDRGHFIMPAFWFDKYEPLPPPPPLRPKIPPIKNRCHSCGQDIWESKL